MWRRPHMCYKMYSSLRSLVTLPVPSEGISCCTEFNLSSELFDDIRKRIYSQGYSIQKIVVSVPGNDESSKNYLMNRNISTPLHCAKHINRSVANNSALSLISDADGNAVYHSMNEPLGADCTLEFIDFNNDKHATEVNAAYWRSCAVVLAYTFSLGLRDSVKIREYHDEVSKSYFAVDIDGLKAQLSTEQLLSLTRFAHSEIIASSLPFEVVTLNDDIAYEYGFSGSRHICRLGSFVTTVSGPVIASTSQIGRFAIVKTLEKSNFVRVAGVSLPLVQRTSSYAWQAILKNAEDKCT